jgi:PilZ domain
MGELGQSSQFAAEALARTGVSGREGAEQRREERYPVCGDAEIVVLGGMSMFRGRVVNISPSGCYVQTVAWVCLAPETAVEILFVVKGHVVRAYAEARFSESKIGLGLRFLTMEEQMKRRLDGIVAALRAAMEEPVGAGKSGQSALKPLTPTPSTAAVLTEAELDAAAVDRHYFIRQPDTPPAEDPFAGPVEGVELSVSREELRLLPGNGMGGNGEGTIAAFAESAAHELVAVTGAVVSGGRRAASSRASR